MVEDGRLNDLASLEVVNDDLFEKLRSYPSVPHPFGVHNDNWATCAHAEAGRFAALYARGSKEEVLALEK